jgi:MFS family permease
MAGNTLSRMSMVMLMVLAPLYALDELESPTAAGLTVTVYMTAATLVRPLAGHLVDRFGRYLVLVGAGAAFAAISGLFALAPPMILFLVLRLAQGAAFGLSGTAGQTMATDIIPDSRLAEGLGYLGVEQVLVQTSAPFLAVALLNMTDYSVAYGVAFAFGVLSLLLRFGLPRNTASRVSSIGDSAAAGPSAWWTRIVEPNAWRASSVMFLVQLGAASNVVFLVAFAQQKGIDNPGPFYVGSGIAVLVARLLAGRLLRRHSPSWVVVPALLLMSASMLCVLVAEDSVLFTIAGVLFGLGMGGAQPTLSALSVISAPTRQRGLANATFFMAMDAAQAIGALTLGLLAFWVAAAVILAAVVLFVLLHGQDSSRALRAAG